MNIPESKQINKPEYHVGIPVLFFFMFASCLFFFPGKIQAEIVELPSGLKFEDTVKGSGKEAVKGSTAIVHYTGWLNKGGKKGEKFDSSLDRGQEFSFPLGAGAVIKGWDEGVQGMKTGGKRTLFVPSALGYGSRGAGGVIPPGADLVFDVELLDVK
jgi:peptidylprolyl isomerase